MAKLPDLLATFRLMPLFHDCTDDELRQIDAVADEVAVPAGRVLIRQGELGREFVVIVDGEASVERDGATAPRSPRSVPAPTSANSPCWSTTPATRPSRRSPTSSCR
jgi:hypothetical protein